LVTAAAAERSSLGFQMGERQALFDLRTGARNALLPAVLQGFRCPVVQ
jgi:hypothetical protein